MFVWYRPQQKPQNHHFHITFPTKIKTHITISVTFEMNHLCGSFIVISPSHLPYSILTYYYYITSYLLPRPQFYTFYTIRLSDNKI